MHEERFFLCYIFIFSLFTIHTYTISAFSLFWRKSVQTFAHIVGVELLILDLLLWKMYWHPFTPIVNGNGLPVCKYSFGGGLCFFCACMCKYVCVRYNSRHFLFCSTIWKAQGSEKSSGKSIHDAIFVSIHAKSFPPQPEQPRYPKQPDSLNRIHLNTSIRLI